MANVKKEAENRIAASGRLFACNDLSVWDAALVEEASIAAASNSGKSTDASKFGPEESFVSSEYRGPLTRQKLSQVVKWKLKRGTFRPGLLQKAESNPEDKIKEAWRAAAGELASVSDASSAPATINAAVTAPIKQLDKNLFGVGPATASALLAPLLPEWVAFMSDEALLATGLFQAKTDLKYHAKTYSRFNLLMLEKAGKLREQAGKRANGPSKRTPPSSQPQDRPVWTPELVQRVLREKYQQHGAGAPSSSTTSASSSPLADPTANGDGRTSSAAAAKRTSQGAEHSGLAVALNPMMSAAAPSGSNLYEAEAPEALALSRMSVSKSEVPSKTASKDEGAPQAKRRKAASKT